MVSEPLSKLTLWLKPLVMLTQLAIGRHVHLLCPSENCFYLWVVRLVVTSRWQLDSKTEKFPSLFSRPAIRGVRGQKPPAASCSLKFSDLLFILLYLVYFCPPNARLPSLKNIFLPHHSMFSSCVVAVSWSRYLVNRICAYSGPNYWAYCELNESPGYLLRIELCCFSSRW